MVHKDGTVTNYTSQITIAGRNIKRKAHNVPVSHLEKLPTGDQHM